MQPPGQACGNRPPGRTSPCPNNLTADPSRPVTGSAPRERCCARCVGHHQDARAPAKKRPRGQLTEMRGPSCQSSPATATRTLRSPSPIRHRPSCLPSPSTRVTRSSSETRPRTGTPVYVDVTTPAGDRLPVIPPHLRTAAGVRAAARYHAGRHAHRAAYHGLRSPRYQRTRRVTHSPSGTWERLSEPASADSSGRVSVRSCLPDRRPELVDARVRCLYMVKSRLSPDRNLPWRLAS